MRAALLFAALLLAGCTSTTPPATTPPAPTPTPAPAPSGTCTNNGVVTGTPPGSPGKLGTIRVSVNTSKGAFLLKLYGDDTPVTVSNFANLSRSGYYDCTRFHRILTNFMNQGGDPLTKDKTSEARFGTGGPGYTIPDEFPCMDGTMSRASPSTCAGHDGLKYKFDRAGLLAMANTGNPNTGGSQFFITTGKPAHLDGRHTIFGEVEQGMDTISAINNTPNTGGNEGRPLEDVFLAKATIAT